MPLYVLLGLLSVAFMAYAWSKIFVKAGFPAWLGVLMVVPVANLFVFFVFAFGRWPMHDRLTPPDDQGRWRLP